MLDIVVTDDDYLSAIWLKDLAFHRLARRPARRRWFPEHALHVFTRLSHGQLEWTSVADLRKLTDVQAAVTQLRHTIEVAQIHKLRKATLVIPDLSIVAEALSTTKPELEFLAERHASRVHWSDGGDSELDVKGLAWSNPLIQFWELQQLVDLYQAAWYSMEDTACDLITELWASRPLSVVAAAGGCSQDWLTERVANARSARGGPGDPRRLIGQRIHDAVPLPLRNDSMTRSGLLGRRKSA